MFTDGLLWLQSQLSAHAGSAIVYHAGQTSIEISDAVLGKSEYETEDGTGAKIRSIVTDWLIAPARLQIDDVQFEPVPGHRIDQTVDGVTRRYEVQNLGAEGCWRFSGPSRDRYRIHVREIPVG
jgi:hypothetical protein